MQNFAYAAAVQADGKIIAVGNANTGVYTDFAIARYNVDGSLDTSFGRNGQVTTPIGIAYDYAVAAAVQADGKIVAAGYAYPSASGTNDFALVRYNADGSLDTTFGVGGKVMTDIRGGQDYAAAMAVQVDGKIVVAGRAMIGSTEDFALVRYNADGSLDTTFGVGGKAITDLGGTDRANSLAIQPDGAIVVAGNSTLSGNSDFALVRYNADGSLDTAFDGDGKATLDFGTNYDAVNSVAVQADGKIIAGGSAYFGANGSYMFALARYNADGSLDTAFDGDGKLTTAISLSAQAYSIMIQTDGKIIAGGSAYVNSTTTYDFALARYNADGSLDASFDGDGILTTGIGTAGEQGRAIVSWGADKIILVGYAMITTTNAAENFALARYNADGSLDASFDGDGKVTTSVGHGVAQANAIALQPDGKTVLAGSVEFAGVRHFAVARQNADGSLDTTFGVGGQVVTPVGSSRQAQANSVAIQADGKIVAAGTAYSDIGHDFAVVRYNADGSLDTTFDGDGKVTTDMVANVDRGYAVAIQADGKIVVAGAVANNLGQDFALARYNADGSLDASFDGDGKVITDVGTTAWTNYSDGAYAVTIQPDGKIVAAGFTQGYMADYFALARYNADGSLDASFGSGADLDGKAGIVMTNLGTGYFGSDDAYAVAVQPDGKIIAVGGAYLGNYSGFGLARYNADGSLDLSFGNNGWTVTTMGTGTGNEQARAVAVRLDGKIVVAGYVYNGASNDVALAIYNANGTLDLSFSDDGKVMTDVAAGDDRAYAVVIRNDGNIVVAGFGRIGGEQDYVTVAYDMNLCRTLPPTVVITEPADGLLTNQTTISVAWTVNGVVQTSELTEQLLIEGENVITRSAANGGGIGSDSVAVIRDTMAPETTITATPPSSASTVVFQFVSSETPSAFECSLDGGAYAACVSGVSYVGLADGAHSFAVRATDLAGNTDSTPAVYDWTLSTVVPPVAVSGGALVSCVMNPDGSFACTITGNNGASYGVMFPAGTTPLSPNASIELDVRSGNVNKPKIQIEAQLPPGQTKTVQIPRGSGNYACVDDSPEAEFSTGTGCLPSLRVLIPAPGTSVEYAPGKTIAVDAANSVVTLTGLHNTVVEAGSDDDGDGAEDEFDACPVTPGRVAWQGCPSAVQVTVQRQTLKDRSYSGDAKEAVVGATVKLFAKNDACVVAIGTNPHNYGVVYDNCAPFTSATTDSSGVSVLGIRPTMDYLAIVQDPETGAYAGVSTGRVSLGQLATKFIQVTVHADDDSVYLKNYTAHRFTADHRGRSH
ncbi:MAG: delta-60 repeat domain-containing protein [Patescibacteria group bacterium]